MPIQAECGKHFNICGSTSLHMVYKCTNLLCFSLLCPVEVCDLELFELHFSYSVNFG